MEKKISKEELYSESYTVGSLNDALKRERSREKDNCWVKLAGKRGFRKSAK